MQSSITSLPLQINFSQVQTNKQRGHSLWSASVVGEFLTNKYTPLSHLNTTWPTNLNRQQSRGQLLCFLSPWRSNMAASDVWLSNKSNTHHLSPMDSLVRRINVHRTVSKKGREKNQGRHPVRDKRLNNMHTTPQNIGQRCPMDQWSNELSIGYGWTPTVSVLNCYIHTAPKTLDQRFLMAK